MRGDTGGGGIADTATETVAAETVATETVAGTTVASE